MDPGFLGNLAKFVKNKKEALKPLFCFRFSQDRFLK